jgi:hypothetical protein
LISSRVSSGEEDPAGFRTFFSGTGFGCVLGFAGVVLAVVAGVVEGRETRSTV